MKAVFSGYLDKITPRLRELVEILGEEYDYVSLLSTDSVGFKINVSQRNKSLSNENITTERGTVVRVCRGGLYSEYAFDEMPGCGLADAAAASEASAGGYPAASEASAGGYPAASEASAGARPAGMRDLAAAIRRALDGQLLMLKAAGVEPYETSPLADEPLELFVEKDCGVLPEEADLDRVVGEMSEFSAEGMRTIPGALDCMVSATSTHISKIFVSKNRFLRQSYVQTEVVVAAYAVNDAGETKFVREGMSGCCGPELLDRLKEKLALLPKTMSELLTSGRMEPGDYDVITTPEVSGLIAHEAFGHGVEMDMFVKKRALGAEYIDKRVGSDLVTMHEGALCAEDVSSYAFDDEGTLAGDVTEIDAGFLRAGICDALSAARLGTVPTGNGKRENFAHKAYSRMTNTIFDSGKDTLEAMIASVERGYLLEGVQSGMEDPKHWGIQCIMDRGYEIAGGRLTGKVVSPVIMTGYVPELLGSISMVSGDREVFGSGCCGKGYKEWVRVSDGGPYLKMRARLG